MRVGVRERGRARLMKRHAYSLIGELNLNNSERFPESTNFSIEIYNF